MQLPPTEPIIDLKRERIRRQTYPAREDAKTDAFDYIERFYNRWRRHAYLGYTSPGEFEKQVMTP